MKGSPIGEKLMRNLDVKLHIIAHLDGLHDSLCTPSLEVI
jgi:hypothetical protein